MTDTKRVMTAPVAHDDEVRANIQPEELEVAEGTGLALSGGGFRAMLFHAGALWRLNHSGLLADFDRISSVSGGSIISGLLGLRWNQLEFNDGVATQYVPLVVEPIMEFADETIDIGSTLRGVLLPGPVSKRISQHYRRLYGDATLQDLPWPSEGPQFVFNATNLQSGVLWRFTKLYMADYKVGMVSKPEVPLADVVAASSAFPPFLSPFDLRVKRSEYTEESQSWPLARLQKRRTVTLSDGGVYDNLGLQTIFDRYRTVLVSDGGEPFEAKDRVARDWIFQTLRVVLTIHRQVGALRKAQLIEAYQMPKSNVYHRKGTYWGVGSEVDNYGLDDPFDVDQELATEIAAIPTRLAGLSEKDKKRLVNWGFVICDTALRRWVLVDEKKPDALPYPDYPLN